MGDLIERLRAMAPDGRSIVCDGRTTRNMSNDITEAADELAALRERVAELEAENDRLTKAVGSGILGELLDDEETDEFVKFIKFLRGQSAALSRANDGGEQ